MKKLKARKVEDAKKEKEMKQKIKVLTKQLEGFEKTKQKAIEELEALGKKVEVYEKALFVADGVVKYLRKFLENVYNLILENKVAFIYLSPIYL